MHPHPLRHLEAGIERNQVMPRYRDYREDIPQPRSVCDLIEPIGKLANAGAITGVVGTAMSQTMNVSLRVPLYIGDSLAAGAPESLTSHPNMVLALLPVFVASYALTRCVEAGAKQVFYSRQARRSTPTRSQAFIGQMRAIPGNAISKLLAYAQKVSTEISSTLETE